MNYIGAKMESKLIDTAELEQKLHDYLENQEEMPFLTVGTVINMMEACKDKTTTNMEAYNGKIKKEEEKRKRT